MVVFFLDVGRFSFHKSIKDMTLSLIFPSQETSQITTT